MTTHTDTTRAEALRDWAAGSLPLMASVELLTAALDGRLLQGPWIRSDDKGHYWFDAPTAAEESGYLSGGERRVLSVATSLASNNHPVDLNDAITGLDPSSFTAVIQALGTAYGLSQPTTSITDSPKEN